MVVVALAMLGEYDIRSRTGSPATCPPSSSTRRTASRTPRRRAKRSPTSGAKKPTAWAAGRPTAKRAPPRRASGQRRGRRRPALGPAHLRAGAGIRRQPAVVQHPGRPAADAARPARPGGAGRLLDLQLHQLPAHAALPEGLGPALPQGRPDDRRRPLARVPLRERRGQRRRRDRAQRDPLSGRPGQRPRHLERLGQPVLAGRVLRRRRGQGALRPLRRGQIRREGARDPRAARRSRPPRRRAASPARTGSRPRPG